MRRHRWPGLLFDRLVLPIVEALLEFAINLAKSDDDSRLHDQQFGHKVDRPLQPGPEGDGRTAGSKQQFPGSRGPPALKIPPIPARGGRE
jgi:hypothetical protein